ncbi:MAG: protein-export chaperone SecB [Alphaproteobacteria bacterium]|nr:protein-export chaperone SecB [Alphaproteobacteria bacterium]
MSKKDEKIAISQETNPNAVPLFINGQFIKDFSFESPHAPQIFNEMKQAPSIEIGVDIQAGRLDDKNTFGVDLKFSIEGKIEDKVAFIVELVYSSVVTLNVEKEHIEPMLLIEVPRHMFPFARSIICDAVRDGGFPPLMIAPIDFVTLYSKRQEQMKKEQTSQETSKDKTIN